jgi:Na+/proline symporter
MTKTIAWTLLIALTAVVVVLSAVNPAVLGRENAFLDEYAGVDMLNVLGVILAITLASAGQLHLTLNQIEERHKTKSSFVSTRASIMGSAYMMIWLFCGGMLLLAIKSAFPDVAWARSFFNGAAVVVTIWNVLVLVSLTGLIFRIKPEDPA